MKGPAVESAHATFSARAAGQSLTVTRERKAHLNAEIPSACCISTITFLTKYKYRPTVMKQTASVVAVIKLIMEPRDLELDLFEIALDAGGVFAERPYTFDCYIT
jgi:hypothetical protein